MYCNARADFQCSLVATFSSSPPIRFISVELFLFSPIANLQLSAARYRALDPKGRTVRARLYGHVDWTSNRHSVTAIYLPLELDWFHVIRYSFSTPCRLVWSTAAARARIQMISYILYCTVGRPGPLPTYNISISPQRMDAVRYQCCFTSSNIS
jgi:hypothetical protein